MNWRGNHSCFLIHRILEVVEDVAREIPIPENETSVTIILTSFSVTVSELDPESFQGFSFVPKKNVSDITAPRAPITLSIPQSFFESVNLPKNSENETNVAPRISNTVYDTDALFGRRNNNSFVVGSIIASATLSVGSQVVRVTGLDPPISLTFTKRPEVINGSNVSCNFWSFSADGEACMHAQQARLHGLLESMML